MKGQRSLGGLEEGSGGVFKGTQNTRVHGREGARRAEEGQGEVRRPAASRQISCLPGPRQRATHGSRLRATVSNHKSQEGLPLSFHPSPKVRPSFLWAVPPPGKKGLSDAVSYY